VRVYLTDGAVPQASMERDDSTVSRRQFTDVAAHRATS